MGKEELERMKYAKGQLKKWLKKKPKEHNPKLTGVKVKPSMKLLYTFLRCPKFGVDRRIVNCLACFKSNKDCERGKKIDQEFGVKPEPRGESFT